MTSRDFTMMFQWKDSMIRVSLAMTCLFSSVLHSSFALGQEKQPKPASKPLNPAVAATVDGTPVLVREVERELERALGKRKLDPQGAKFLKAQSLEQLIGRQLVLKYLATKKAAATK